MNIFNIFSTKKEISSESVKDLVKETIEQKPESVEPQNHALTTGYSSGYGSINIGGNYVFNGEKTPGELGRPIHLIPDFYALRMRAYEAELKSDIVKIITGKFFKWVVGDGLKMQPEPNEVVLKSEGILNFESSIFKELSEARFREYSEMNISDYSGMENVHHRAAEAFETAFLGGDCLTVLRVEKGSLNVQVIDGQHINTPVFEDKWLKAATDRGNTIKHGIEVDKRGRHVAFYVLKDNQLIDLEYERIEAYNKEAKCTVAWMIYGKKHRIDHVRGITTLAPILEKLDKLDRYTEAAVGSAEERAKVPWFIEHNRFSDGENPYLEAVKRGTGSAIEKSSFDLATPIARDIAVTQGKQVSNLPIGATMKALFSQNEINYDSFFQSIFLQLCASCDIPPEVALQKYSSNYSASRAAINGWGYIINIYRKKHARKFYRNFYNFWVYLEVIKGKLNCPGFLEAKEQENEMVVSAYTNAKFLGVNLPHIDPLKEVKAIREMIGDRSKGQVPLINYDMATEELNNGDWREILKRYLEEMKATEGYFDIPEPEPTIKEK